MSVLVRFVGAPNMTAERYDAVIAVIEESGPFPPDGLAFHAAFTAGDAFCVSEIWDSKEQFEAFAPRLMPILEERGVELSGPPEIVEVHNVVQR